MATTAKVLRLGFVALLALLAICVFRALVYFPEPQNVDSCTESTSHKPIDSSRGLISRFQRAIQFRTITKSRNVYDAAELLRFITFIETSMWRLDALPPINVITRLPAHPLEHVHQTRIRGQLQSAVHGDGK